VQRAPPATVDSTCQDATIARWILARASRLDSAAARMRMLDPRRSPASGRYVLSPLRHLASALALWCVCAMVTSPTAPGASPTVGAVIEVTAQEPQAARPDSTASDPSGAAAASADPAGQDPTSSSDPVPTTSAEWFEAYWKGVDEYWKDKNDQIFGGSTPESKKTFETRIDAGFGIALDVVGFIPFFNLLNVTLLWGQAPPTDYKIPFVVLWLVVAAVFFTLRFGFINFRLFGHAVGVVSGKYTDPNEHGQGEVSHFQALTSALSATVGLGNIAGVAIAIATGGPGAMFWMMVAGTLGMTLKFTECTLAQQFRTIDAHGRVSGGPMHYLVDGLTQKGYGPLGAFLGVFFMVFCVGGSFAGGCAFQVNQSLDLVKEQFGFFEDNGWVYGTIMAIAAGVVIIGGIRRIAQTAEKIVPTMVGIYLVGVVCVLLYNFTAIPAAIGTILDGAFGGNQGDAVKGGLIGALVVGFQRAAFSNEAGVGSAAIAHSAARTEYPVREGIVALLEPFIDTVFVCSMTALVIVMSGVYTDVGTDEGGAALTSRAFETVPFLAGWFPYVLLFAAVLFAFSTMISWSYYGERCWTKLFGPRSSLVYKFVFMGFVVLGSITSATNVLNFGDLMILTMAFPNVIGLYFLAGRVREELRGYLARKNAGEFPTFD
jgi:AGCS family alanine or glycine:cation symporter